MRRFVAALLVIAACGGSPPAQESPTDGQYDRAALEYAATAMRAVEETAFEVLDAAEVAELVAGLCEGLGVGAMGVVVADLGIAAPDDDVAILLEVLRTGLDQVCEEIVALDRTAVYLDAVETAVAGAGAESAYDRIAAIRAAPAVCRELGAGSGAEQALLQVVEILYGIEATDLDGLEIDPVGGSVAGSVLAAATAVLCPEHVDEVQSISGSS